MLKSFFGDVIYVDNSIYTTIIGVTVNETTNTMTFNNQYTENVLNLSENNIYNNVINIDGSTATGAKKFVGNANSNSIKAGNGGSTLWGGGQGNNTLVGGNGQDYFQYSGKGYDVVQNFTTGKNANSDVLYFGTSLTKLRRENSYMQFDSSDGTYLQVNNSSSVDEAIKYTADGTNIAYAKVGRANQSNSFTYEGGVNFYQGGDSTDVLKITDYQATNTSTNSTPSTTNNSGSSTDGNTIILYNAATVANTADVFTGVSLSNSKSKNIWLNGLYGDAIYDNINNIDASTSTGDNTLAGDGGSNKITAGSGADSLWGEAGNDTLVGGSGENMFWYGKGGGKDVINKASSSDSINLYDVNLTDITSINYVGNTIQIGLNSGGNLQINSAENMSSKFMLADGSTWKYNHSTENWQNA